jgi:hypothetical protein
MYSLNDRHPLFGIEEQYLNNNDRIIFHYSDDYTQEEGSEKWNPPTGGAGGTTEPGTTAGDTDTENRPNLPSDTFKDVFTSDWFYSAVKYVSDKGIMQGTGNGLFSPNANLTRAMLVTMLYRYEGAAGITAANPFKDVPSGGWYTDAVIWASEKGIVNGYGNGLFGSNNNITREQFAVILYNYAKMKGINVSAAADLSSFTDSGKTSAWALPAMKWAVASGLLQGRSGNALAPDGTATRAEAATLLMRFIEQVLK